MSRDSLSFLLQGRVQGEEMEEKDSFVLLDAVRRKKDFKRSLIIVLWPSFEH